MHEQSGQLAERARLFAERAHGDQRYGDEPYLVHLEAVAALLREEFGFGERPEILAAAFLHDVLEDTPTTPQTLAEAFGGEVAAMVAFCTDEPSGANRKQRKAATYARMRRTMEAAPDRCFGAVAVKLADRLANLRACVTGGRAGLLDMYRREQPAFRETLYVPGVHEPLWTAIQAALDGR